jgi:hypothetical protein
VVIPLYSEKNYYIALHPACFRAAAMVLASAPLGLAIQERGVLVSFDKGIHYMAGAEFRQNILLLE